MARRCFVEAPMSNEGNGMLNPIYNDKGYWIKINAVNRTSVLRLLDL